MIVDNVLSERESQYGKFVDNIERIKSFTDRINFLHVFVEDSSLFSFFLSLKLARLYYITNKSKKQFPKSYSKEDSYIDLLGYLTLIVKNYPDSILVINKKTNDDRELMLLNELEMAYKSLKKQYAYKKTRINT